jgi:AraC-like DNA-binding protein
VGEDLPDRPRYQRHPSLGVETVAYRGPLEHMPRHAHAEFQLTLYDGGPRRFNIARQEFTGGPRTAVIIQAGEPHSSWPTADPVVGLRTFYLDEGFVAEVAASLWGGGGGTVAFATPALAEAGTVARLAGAHRALDRGEPGADEAACLAVEWLVRRHARATGPARRLADAGGRIARARALLEDRAAETVTLAELAAAADLSRFHLIRLFRREYGLTPFAYQRQLRVERARAVLREGRSIAAAAAEAGFADQSHLGRAFRAAMGATPGEYRASYLRPGVSPPDGAPAGGPSGWPPSAPRRAR